MTRILILAYAIVSYVLFLLVTLWMAAFLLDLAGIRSAGPQTHWGMAVAIDIGLITVFGAVHSIMARPAFKKVWTRIIPPAAERATYNLQSSILLATVFFFWQPISETIWNVEGVSSLPILGLFLFGLGLIVLATFMLDHFEFTGLRQAWNNLNGTPPNAPEFRTPLIYRIVRHPLQLGIVIVMFSVPHMTADGLLFACVMLIYIFIGLRFEERALLREFGDEYAAYQARVPMLVPGLSRQGRSRRNA